ncbi:rho guanine nucleotide exchange factor 12 isoform X1 [Alosa alosa]|uniref:rho guanine nucleotide exchange factor 12 isoform X1 n=1 Tax=Alosa alosa TaxID=278164 RepID=UPI0020155008|nr:rho guanine nucleotide exchange factor 12 isoform X1 [Alosa alosa]XP_048086332.1 rho guanine nucleotide exchange factor 12 isoform X1 [Alosa alosa]
MSGIQSTITDRFPKKTTRTGSILGKDHPPDKKSKSDKPAVSSSNEFDPTDALVQNSSLSSSSSSSSCVVADGKPESCGLVQRCVIIQRDENGFGLTVSGDNPVFVQLVKEDGAAMRAGVQTGDRIIKVNGTLVTHSNHVEVVKLIKSGSYVALTVLGRPPGLPQIPLSEGEGDSGSLSLSSPHSPGPTTGERSSTSSSPSDRVTSPLPAWEENSTAYNQKVDILHLQKMLTKQQQNHQAMKEECSRNPSPKLLKEIQEAKKHITLLQGQLSKATAAAQDGGVSSQLSEADVDEVGGGESEQPLSWATDSAPDSSWPNSTAPPASPYPNAALPDSPCQRETPCHSPKTTPRGSLNSCPSPDTEDLPELDSQSSLGSPMSRQPPQIIGAEDDYFGDTEQDQINGQCSCFQSMELLKSRPAHLAAFLHHVVSQFDPAPLLCYLYADLYKQTNPKETRRIFTDLHTYFMDRTANLKVAVPESISAELEKRRAELLPEETHRQYVQLLQDTLLTDIQKNLEDFRQKRSMGLTLGEAELTRLDAETGRNRVALERERSCAEHIISKIEEVLLTSQPTEEEKCSTMQYVILTYMKHLGVKVKEPRGLEPKPKRINFNLPKIKVKGIKPEKEGEEKVKKARFPPFLGPPRRPSRIDPPSIGKAMEMNKQRPQKQLSQPALSVTDQSDSSSPLSAPAGLGGGRLRSSQSSDGSDTTHVSTIMTSPPHSAPAAQGSDATSRDADSGSTPSSAQARLGDGVHLGDPQDGSTPGASTHFDFGPCALEQLQEEEPETDRTQDGGTPKPARRMDPLGSGEVHSEDDQGGEVELEQDPSNWQMSVPREILQGLASQEIKRQEVIYELFYTERTHLRMLRVLDNVFYQKLSRESILPPGDVKHIFTNLEEIVQLHASILEQMMATRKKNESSVISLIGDDLLTWFSGTEEEKIKQAVGTFCSNQPFALELIKSRQKKDQRFTSFMQEAESNQLCRRLQLKDIIPMEMMRLTKYPLLLENIARNTEDLEEKDKVKRAAECCRNILNHVNQAVKEAENKQRLEDYQRRLDLSSFKQSENPMISEFKNLDLTKRKLVHEGPLSWKVNKDKTIELYTLLLEDILVLLQRQDERLILKCHSKNLAGTADTKHIFSPIIKLSTVLVRSVATDNKSFFVLSMSDSGAQIYELMAQTVSEQRTWQCLITQRADSMKMKQHNIIPLPQTDGDRETVEMINSAGVQKLNKDSDRISTGSIQSPEKDVASTQGVLDTPPPGSNPFESSKSEDEEEEEESLTVPLEEEGPFLDTDLADKEAFIKPGSCPPVVLDDEEPEAFGFPSSRADEALKTLAALRQLLITHMSAEEGERAEGAGEHTDMSAPPPGPKDNGGPAPPAENSSERTAPSQAAAELPSTNTALFETPEYALLLEGYGGFEESSTDDDIQGADSDVDVTKLLSSSQTTGVPNLSRQVMTHIRLLQANLQHLKEVEIKYHELRQSLAEAATDTVESKDQS